MFEGEDGNLVEDINAHIKKKNICFFDLLFCNIYNIANLYLIFFSR